MEENSNLYNEFLIYQELIEKEERKKLEITTISNGVFGYQINPEVLNKIIDYLALNGNIKNDETTKNIYKNSYLFARKVAYQDLMIGSRGMLHDEIMEEIFNHTSKIFSRTIPKENIIPFKYSEIISSNKLIDCYGLEDGNWKNPTEMTKKYGPANQDKLFITFCAKFIDKLYRKKQKEKHI